MPVPPIVGLETEYGIAAPGDPSFNPVVASSLLISAYAGDLRRIRWDFEDESPMLDARDTAGAVPRWPLEDDAGLANVVLPNGARFYVDHAHPEYSTPECRRPLAAVAHAIAGDRILERALRRHAETYPGSTPLVAYKNNSDGKGNSYGAHENYLVSRAVPFDDLVAHLLAFLVTRQVFTGAGKVGAEGAWFGEGTPGFQVTQRADFFEAEVGLETTLKRPIINTRDEPHALRDRYRRLHVIVGDANLSEVATFLKVGTFGLVLRMLEAGTLPRIELEDPLGDIRRVSHDTTCRTPLRIKGGGELTAVEAQVRYLEAAEAFVGAEGPEPDDAEVLRLWRETLEGLSTDPLSQAMRLDWVAKYAIVRAYRERHDLPWNSPRLQLLDLQYHDVRRDRGLHHVAADAGRMERLLSEEAIVDAIEAPPEDTRAWFRGRCIARFGDHLVAASWDSLTFDTGDGPLRRLSLPDPLRGTREVVGGVLDAADDLPALLDALAAPDAGPGLVGDAR